jgi:hypothetical protein
MQGQFCGHFAWGPCALACGAAMVSAKAADASQVFVLGVMGLSS